MVVVDSNLIAQLQTDNTGIDLMELGLNLMRAQMIQDGSSTSFLDSESTSKRMSSASLDFLPPSYEEIFGSKADCDLPPSYSEVSMMLMLRSLAQSGFEYGRDRSADSVSVDMNEDGRREETDVDNCDSVDRNEIGMSGAHLPVRYVDERADPTETVVLSSCDRGSTPV